MRVRPLPTLLAAVALLAAGVVPAAVAATPMQDGTRTVAAGKKVVGYFTEWGVYDRNYHVKNIKTSGSAAKLTNIVYAFGNTTNGRCTMGDAYAANDKFYDAASSVDGVADTWDTGALRGNFNQLRKLKREFPNIKVVWSFGGWTWSGGFTR
jgi:chitinase